MVPITLIAGIKDCRQTVATHHFKNLGDSVFVAFNLNGIGQRKMLSKMLNTCTLFDPTSGVALLISGIHCQSRLWIRSGFINL